MTKAERVVLNDETQVKPQEQKKTPRSDWHAAFVTLVRTEAHKLKDHVQILTEQQLGEQPPRVDLIVLIDEIGNFSDKAIFRIFRKHNICEYKNPSDEINYRVIRKVSGYANFYISTSDKEDEDDILSEEVTVSIFRATKPVKLFRKMMAKGQLKQDSTKGIYHVEGIIDLPFQIVITRELEGPEYAAYRALTNNARREDVEQVILESRNSKDSVMQDYYRIMLEFIARKNPNLIKIIRSDKIMETTWMDIFKDKIDEKIQEGRDKGLKEGMEIGEKEGKQKTLLNDIRNIMDTLGLSLEKAMDALKIPKNQRNRYIDLMKQG